MTADAGAVYDYDVCIVGAGAVGGVLATALASLPLRVALVEARPPTGELHDDAQQARCTALSHGSQQILQTLGVWPHLQGVAEPIHQIHVSDRGQFGATRLDAAQEGVDALGYVVQNDQLQRSLWQLLGARAAPTPAPGANHGASVLHLWAPVRVVGAHADTLAATLRIAKDGQPATTLRARLLVAADGARSGVRELFSIGAVAESYRQQAIVANVTPANGHGQVAYERFIGSGPLALLPLRNGRCNLVWSVWRDDAPGLMALDDEQFIDALQSAFGYRLGRFDAVTPRLAYPLTLQRSDEASLPPRLVLIGNAATGVHPVAGQGLNLGLRDAAGLAELVASSCAEGQSDVGRGPLVEAFAGWRREDRRDVSTFTDTLVRVFTQPAAPLGVARGLGLLALDLLPGAKSIFARKAMGYGGRAPRLARGLPLLAQTASSWRA